MPELESLTPANGLGLYLKHRADECAESTLKAHEYRLGHFVRWCESNDIDNLNEITGRRLHEFRLWRKEDGDLNRVSVRTQMSTLRAFMKFCAQIDAVDVGLKDAVDVPELDDSEGVRSVHIESEQAERILTQLRKYEYASLRHMLILLLWRTALRTGGVRAIDVDDVDLEEGYVEIRHREKYGTPLKNQDSGERFVSLKEDTCGVLSDWIDECHPGVEDENGRTPLLATKYGRISRSNVRKHSYWVTRPQFIGEDCSCVDDDHDYESVHECEDVVSPHGLRRGSITYHLRSGLPRPVVSERSDVSQDVLDKHYDQTTLEEQMDLRRDHLENI